jgi:hypothetical protein
MNDARQRRRWKNTATDAIAANQKCALREERLQPKKGGGNPCVNKKAVQRTTNLSLHDSKMIKIVNWLLFSVDPNNNHTTCCA